MQMGLELFLLLFGGVLVLSAIRVLVRNISIKKNGEYADAVVVETIRERMRSAGGPKPVSGFTYVPVLKYHVDGRMYKVKFEGRAKPKYEDGETVKIIYNKKDVKDAVIVGDNVAYIVSTVFGLVGVVMLGIGLYMYWI